MHHSESKKIKAFYPGAGDTCITNLCFMPVHPSHTMYRNEGQRPSRLLLVFPNAGGHLFHFRLCLPPSLLAEAWAKVGNLTWLASPKLFQ